MSNILLENKNTTLLSNNYPNDYNMIPLEKVQVDQFHMNNDHTTQKDTKKIVKEDDVKQQVVKSKPFKMEYKLLFPIQNKESYKWYELQLSNLWTIGEIDMTDDKNDWDTLEDDVKKCLTTVLTYFVMGDNIVIENLGKYLVNAITELHGDDEDGLAYGVQTMIEGVHRVMYETLFKTYLSVDERKKIMKELQSKGIVKKMLDWSVNYIQLPDGQSDKVEDSQQLSKNLIAFIITEGIFFQGPFAILFWFKSMFKSKLNGLTQSNKTIARDETVHTKFSIYQHNRLKKKNKLPTKQIHQMFQSGVELATEFASVCFRGGKFIGINKKLMGLHIRYMTNIYLKELGLPILYPKCRKCPFEFMKDYCVTVKTNFFEKRVMEYGKVGVLGDESFEFIRSDDY